MLTGNHENISQESLQIKQESKFFSRLMSKETSMANSSSSVYYGGASGSVPFFWESHPGTPKHTFSHDNTPPPLTPPPFYQSISKSNSCQENANPNHNLLLSFINFPRVITRSFKKNNHVSPSSSWSCNSLSSSSFSCSSTDSSKPRRKFSLTRLPMVIHFLNEEDDDDDEEDKNYRRGCGSLTSTLLCFIGGHNKQRSLSKSKGCYSIMEMKKALLAIVGGGH